MLISKTVILTIKAVLSTHNLYFNVGLFIEYSYYHQLGSFVMVGLLSHRSDDQLSDEHCYDVYLLMSFDL